MRRLINVPGITLVIFFLWKVALLLFTAQPVPSNDAFFYDGPVVNYLLHGKYCNPAIAPVLPISGNEVFSAYPPLYQAVLLGWMKCFGTTALAAMWLHVVLLGGFALIVGKIFQQLQVSASAANLGGLFLFGITFHDRPDTLAHGLGALAILALVRGLTWPSAVFLLLTFGTSLQIGGIYSLWAAALVLTSVWLGQCKFPWGPGALFFAAFVGLVAWVKLGHPHWWEGFREHVRITPSFTGFRIPAVDDVLKVLRTAPGILIGFAGFIALVTPQKNLLEQISRSPQLLVAGCGSMAALALIGGCLFVLTPNAIHIAGYLQPIIVGCLFGTVFGEPQRSRVNKLMPPLFVAAALLVSVRAIGMTTWGVLCARDVSYRQAVPRLNQELDALPAGATVLVSSAYLYEAAQRTNLAWIHSDWPNHAASHDGGITAIEELKPARLMLTQFDYYRRFEPVVAQFRERHKEVAVRITNLAQLPSPEARPATRKVIQHISWAPVVVEFSWPSAGQSR
ncbi:MAG TPA: hypothetical protein VFZ59_07585 [Verrucomicrobiae bacterium]|nr:hypothetical protein [Verrucomicrobiae bacterium]